MKLSPWLSRVWGGCSPTLLGESSGQGSFFSSVGKLPFLTFQIDNLLSYINTITTLLYKYCNHITKI